MRLRALSSSSRQHVTKDTLKKTMRTLLIVDLDPPTFGARVRKPYVNAPENSFEEVYPSFVVMIDRLRSHYEQTILMFERQRHPTPFPMDERMVFSRSHEKNGFLNVARNDNGEPLRNFVLEVTSIDVCGCYLDQCVYEMVKEVRHLAPTQVIVSATLLSTHTLEGALRQIAGLGIESVRLSTR